MISNVIDVKILVDEMDNRASIGFGAMPERLAVVFDGKLQWIGGGGPSNYSVDDLENYLSTLMIDC